MEINAQIVACTESLSSSKLQFPDDLAELNEVGELIHITWVSNTIGFIDDMYIMLEINPENSAEVIVNIQS